VTRFVSMLTFALCMFLAGAAGATGPRVVAGSKAFPESWILGEALRVLAAEAGAQAEHAQNLGGTEIALAALRTGAIDIYAEYTGTIDEVILRSRDGDVGRARELAKLGIGITDRLGFADSYALAIRADVGKRLGVRTLGDLTRHPELRLGLTHEFLGRADGFPGLAAAYGLAPEGVRGLQHELAYAAVAGGSIDVLDVYTTDPQIERLALAVLEDDRRFFPQYDAVLLYRADLPARAPAAFAAMTRLVGAVGTAAMTHANAALVLDHASVEQAARLVLPGAPRAAPAPTSMMAAVAHDTLRHVELVLASLLGSIVLGIPIGIAASRARLLGPTLMTLTGVLQTVPSLALLALLVPFFGIGARPAIVALFLYGLLPIARNTYTGLTSIAPELERSADALGLAGWTKLRRISLPLASRAIFAGVKTSAIINVGTATIAALVGAEGLGNPILQGISLRDNGLILRGALPAAALALVFEAAFAGLEHVFVPRGLRMGPPRA
jgi:osmoprotectant transport system permease protein